MDKKLIKKDKIKEIFTNMEYDKNNDVSVDSAIAWIHDHKFAIFELGKEPVLIQTNAKGSLNINVTRIHNDNAQKLVDDCEQSLKEWSNVTGIQKSKLLNKFASEIEKQGSLICQLELLIRSILPKDTKIYSIPTFIDYFQYYSGWASLWSKQLTNYKPYGICAVSLKSTTPFELVGMIISPCLAAGNVIIISAEKELIPICYLIKENLENIGFPKGIIRIVRGTLDIIIKQEKITKLTYLGDLFHEKLTNVELKENLSLNALHLGKATMIVFDSADIDSACDFVLQVTMGYRGNYPWSVNRIFVQETVYEEFQEKFKKKYFYVTSTDPYLKSTDYSKLIDFKFGAKEAGSNVINENTDSFVNVIAFRTANEAANLSNNTRLGLACSVWTENINLANEIASKLKVGIVWINTHGCITAGCTFTPYKKSGKGYFGGIEGLLEYLRYKETHYNINIANQLNGKNCDVNRKDILKYIESAVKAQDAWKKISITNRNQVLRKFADSSSSINECLTNSWVSSLYEWATISISKTSLNIGTPMLTSVKEPCGIIVLELHTDPNMIGFTLLVSAIACGNSVIVLNRLDNSKFLKDISSKSTLPSGILKIINDPSEEIIQTLKSHQEIQGFYKICNENIVNLKTILTSHDISNLNINSSDCLFDLFTKTKCFWSTNGESFL